MSTKFNIVFNMEISVNFESPELIEKYFINGPWNEVFYKVNDLEDLAKDISFAFHNEEDKWDNTAKQFYRSIEGFGRYYKQSDDSYILDNESLEEIGSMITIKYESTLDIDYVSN